MKLNIMILCNHTNGVKTYTAHLIKGLTAIGVETKLIKYADNTEKFSRKYIADIKYFNMSYMDLVIAGNSAPTLLVSPIKDKDLVNSLVKDIPKIRTVLHADFEVRYGHDFGERPILIRRKLKNLVPEGIYIPHPYMPTYNRKIRKSKHACSISRLDKLKNTGMILGAIIDYGADIDLYGDLMPFYGMYLEKRFPGWKRHWRKKFPSLMGTRIAAEYKYMIDMSVYENDGQGTQYTFLEAIDSGTIPVIHAKWAGGEFQHKKNCLVVESPEQLSKLRGTVEHSVFHTMLRRHDASRVARKYMKEIVG